MSSVKSVLTLATCLLLIAVLTPRAEAAAKAPARPAAKAEKKTPPAKVEAWANSQELRSPGGLYLYVRVNPDDKKMAMIVLADVMPVRIERGTQKDKLIFKNGDRDLTLTHNDGVVTIMQEKLDDKLRVKMNRFRQFKLNPIDEYKAALAKDPQLSFEKFLPKSHPLCTYWPTTPIEQAEAIADEGKKKVDATKEAIAKANGGKHEHDDHKAGHAAEAQDRSELDKAIFFGRMEQVKAMIGTKVDVNHRDFSKSTPIFQAVRHGKADICNYLIEQGADVNAVNRHAFTPLWTAVMAGKLDMVELLVSKGAKVDALDNLGRTPLFHAVILRRADIVEFLAKSGANVNQRDKTGATPLRQAIDTKDEKIVALLRKRGAR